VRILAYIMQRKDATMEEYYAFAREQVLDWTEEDSYGSPVNADLRLCRIR